MCIAAMTVTEFGFRCFKKAATHKEFGFKKTGTGRAEKETGLL